MSTAKRFLTDSVLYGAPMLLARSIGFLLLPIYTRELGPEAFGAVEMTLALVTVGLVVLTLEINQAQGRFLPEQTDRAGVVRLFTNALGVSLATSSVAALALAAALQPLSSWLGLAEDFAAALPWAIAMFLSMATLQVVQIHMRFVGRPVAFGVVNILMVVVTALGVGVFVWLDQLGLREYFIVQLVGSLAGAVAGMLLVFVPAPAGSARIDLALIRKMLRFSLPLFVSSSFIVIATNAERISVATLVSTEQLGQLGVALRLAGLVAVAYTVLSTVLTPFVYRNHEAPETPRFLRNMFLLAAAAAFVGLALSAVIAGPVVTLIAGEGYERGADFLFYVLFSAVLTQSYIFFLGMDIAKRTGIISGISLVSASVVLVGSFTLTALFGVAGAVAAALIGAVVKISLYAVLSERLYPTGIPRTLCACAFGGLLAAKLFWDFGGSQFFAA